MVSNPKALVLFLLVLVIIPPWPSAQSQMNFIAENNLSSMNLFGSSAVIPNVGIRLTEQADFTKGRAVYPQRVRMKAHGSVDGTFSFSTSFVFSIVPPPDLSKVGDGIAFIITPHASQSTALAAQYLGLFDNFTSMGQSYNHLFAVEFDTIKNGEFNDTDGNHVGVDLNSLVSVESKSAGYWIGNEFLELDLKSGQNIQAWIDYNHHRKELNVTVAPAGSLRPEKPLISKNTLSLSSILEEEMYVGFSASTGLLIEENYILAWSFATDGAAPALNVSMLPSVLHGKSKSNNLGLIIGVTTGLVVFLILAAAVAVAVWIKRKKTRDGMEEWEVEYWPHRLSYRDLAIATNGFGEEQVLGSGGFGKVYKGVLPMNGLEVAVKHLLQQTKEGVKEFISEISSLGRLQHRNLVRLRGYCRRGKQLFIVYDYMPNGSLDKSLFGNGGKVLGWGERYRILKDVAAGLLYLHQGWEQRVVHRDIKSSNVLLDSELHGKLGDFGLARLYKHDENSPTSRVVGTPGYIAAEVAHTGKATPESDVFSFGVLMVEIACGRRPVNPIPEAPQVGLVEWVRELQAEENIMDAADPKLNGEYVEEEMERVLRLGLLCSNAQPEARPSMRQVLQILQAEASLVQLSLDMGRRSPTGVTSDNYSTDAYCSISLEAR